MPSAPPSFSVATRRATLATVGLGLPLLAACGGSPQPASGGTPAGPLTIGGIPDQNASTLEQMFGLTAKYLAKATGLQVRYAPAADYAAIVTAFARGDVQLAWFGGLTGVQARAKTPGARAVAQRPRDAEFHSVFVAGPDVPAQDLKGLKGVSFTFGSESSTSGHLMPRHYLLEAGIDADRDLKGQPGYSGSHDKTYKLVESGAYQAGALNEAVWEAALKGGQVDPQRVRVVHVTPAYFDYNWTLHPGVERSLGAGSGERLTRALLDLRPGAGEDEARLLELFATDRFVGTSNDNYKAIERVAEKLGILR